MLKVQINRNDKPIMLQECEFLAVYIHGQIHCEEEVVVSVIGYEFCMAARAVAMSIIEHHNLNFDQKLTEIDEN
jgi:hypothetical protein